MALSREEMAAIIKDGGSVLLDGKQITSLAELPNAEELATTDEEKQAAGESLYNEILGLAERFDKLRPTDDESQGMVAFLKAGASGDIVHSEALRKVEAEQAKLQDERDAQHAEEVKSLKARVAELEKDLEEATAPKTETTTAESAPEPIDPTTAEPVTQLLATPEAPAKPAKNTR